MAYKIVDFGGEGGVGKASVWVPDEPKGTAPSQQSNGNTSQGSKSRQKDRGMGL